MVSVDQVSTPAKEPDDSCRAVPRGATPPARCRPSNLRAEQFWRVTLDVGNKRFVVRPYRAPKLIDALNQSAVDYVDPNVTPASSIEIAVTSAKIVRLRTRPGQELLAMVDSQALIPNYQAPVSPVRPASPSPSGSRVVLLENSDFRDLEAQEFKSQDIGDGAVLYSFAGDTSPVRIASNPPVFLLLAENDVVSNVDLARLQVAKGTRQLVYSAAKRRSASSLPMIVTQVSATLRKFSVKEPLPPGQYVVLLESANRGFLFEVR